jgi:hypothetical protein
LKKIIKEIFFNNIGLTCNFAEAFGCSEIMEILPASERGAGGSIWGRRWDSCYVAKRLATSQSSIGLLVFFVVEFQCCGVDAVSQAGRFWAVLEDVAEMRTAPAADYLGPYHRAAGVHRLLGAVGVDRRREAGPAASGVELCFRSE